MVFVPFGYPASLLGMGGIDGCFSPGSRVILPLCSVRSSSRIWLYFAALTASVAAWSRRIFGRRKTSKLLFCREPLRDLNRLPSSGIAPSTGTRSSLSVTVSCIRPPSTMMPPSSIRMVVLIERLLVEMSAESASFAPGEESSCSILSWMASPSLMCGVTLRMVPTSSRWMVSNGLVVPLTAAVELVYWPVISGISCVTFTSASSLFMVMTRGVEMMLLVPSLRRAWMMAAKPLPVLELYVPTAKVAPVGITEEMLEAAVAPDESPVVPVVVVALVALLVSPLTPPRAAAAISTMLRAGAAGQIGDRRSRARSRRRAAIARRCWSSC